MIRREESQRRMGRSLRGAGCHHRQLRSARADRNAMSTLSGGIIIGGGVVCMTAALFVLIEAAKADVARRGLWAILNGRRVWLGLALSTAALALTAATALAAQNQPPPPPPAAGAADQ